MYQQSVLPASIYSVKKGKSGRRGSDNGNKPASLCFIPAEVAVSAQILFIISDGAVNPHRFFLQKAYFGSTKLFTCSADTGKNNLLLLCELLKKDALP